MIRRDGFCWVAEGRNIGVGVGMERGLLSEMKMTDLVVEPPLGSAM